MTTPDPCPRCLALGLVFSAMFHGAVVQIWPRTPAPEPPSAGPLVLELAHFDPEPAAPEPPAPAETSTESQQAALPEPALAEAPEPPPVAELLPRPRPKARIEQTKPRHAPKPVPVRREPPRRQVLPPEPSLPPPKPSAVRSTVVSVPAAAAAESPTPPRRTTPTAASVPFASSGAAVPARVPAAPPRPPAEHPRRGESEGAYLAEVQRAVARGQVYPADARRGGKSGTAVVAFVIQSNGAISGVRLARSSGDPALDRAALAAVGRVGRVRPIPAAFGRSTWTLQVPIRFALR